MSFQKPENIDQYISDFPIEIQNKLSKIRNIIKKVAPNAIEKINYGIPTFYLNGNLVHFAAYKNHLGFYPGSTGVEAFRDKILNFKNSKGAIQFPYQEELPTLLIEEIVAFRVLENLSK